MEETDERYQEDHDDWLGPKVPAGRRARKLVTQDGAASEAAVAAAVGATKHVPSTVRSAKESLAKQRRLLNNGLKTPQVEADINLIKVKELSLIHI